VYHGTGDGKNIPSILSEGLSPAKGGTGAATIDEYFKDRSKGKVHVTKSKTLARMFAGLTEKLKKEKSTDKLPLLKAFDPTANKRVITATIPDSRWEKFKLDQDMRPPNDIPKSVRKNIAATTTETIDPKYIHKSKHRKRLGLVKELAKGLPKYIKRKPGRFGAGIAGLAGGSALVGKGVSDLKANLLKKESSAVKVPTGNSRVPLAPPKAKRKKWPFQGYVDFQGLKIDVENKRGSSRSGKDPDGKPWKTFMHHHYGEIRGTEGKDGDKLDVYVGKNADSPLVVVVHQQDPKTKKYDEDKVMLGFNDVQTALKAYRKQYNSRGFYQDHSVMNIGQFWRWVHDGRKRGKKVKIASLAKAPRAAFNLFDSLVSTLRKSAPSPMTQHQAKKVIAERDLPKLKKLVRRTRRVNAKSDPYVPLKQRLESYKTWKRTGKVPELEGTGVGSPYSPSARSYSRSKEPVRVVSGGEASDLRLAGTSTPGTRFTSQHVIPGQTRAAQGGLYAFEANPKKGYAFHHSAPYGQRPGGGTLSFNVPRNKILGGGDGLVNEILVPRSSFKSWSNKALSNFDPSRRRPTRLLPLEKTAASPPDPTLGEQFGATGGSLAGALTALKVMENRAKKGKIPTVGGATLGAMGGALAGSYGGYLGVKGGKKVLKKVRKASPEQKKTLKKNLATGAAIGGAGAGAQFGAEALAKRSLKSKSKGKVVDFASAGGAAKKLKGLRKLRKYTLPAAAGAAAIPFVHSALKKRKEPLLSKKTLMDRIKRFKRVRAIRSMAKTTGVDKALGDAI